MPLINFSGIASGIDTEGLIEATSAAKRATNVDPKEDEIAKLDDTNAAFEELNTKLSTLQSLSRGFSSINGGIVSKLGSSTDETVATATASTAATNATYTVNVTQLAKNATISLASTSGTYTTADSVINSNINNGAAEANRTVSIAIGTVDTETVDIILTDSTTLTGFVNEFNETSTKATASVINAGTTSTPDFRILIVSNSTGVDSGEITITDVGNEIDENPGVGNAAFDTNTISQALNAEFTLDGIAGTISRPSNTINDLVTGVTFELRTIGTANISIGIDKTTTISAVEEYLEVYNDIITFVKDNNEIIREEDGEDVDNIFGPLANSRVDDNILTSLRTDFSSATLTTDGLQFNIFAALGITTNNSDGTLDFDEEEFEAALDGEPDSVNQLFKNLGDSSGLTGGTIDQFIRFNGLIDSVTNSADEQITRLNDDISRAEQLIADNEANLRARFARLEARIGELQSQQNSLTGALGGLSA